MLKTLVFSLGDGHRSVVSDDDGIKEPNGPPSEYQSLRKKVSRALLVLPARTPGSRDSNIPELVQPDGGAVAHDAASCTVDGVEHL